VAGERLKARSVRVTIRQRFRNLRTFGLKSGMTRLHGRHLVKGGIDLELLRPREDLKESRMVRGSMFGQALPERMRVYASYLRYA
jgi:hypothetical protein